MTDDPLKTAIVRLCDQITKLIDLQRYPPPKGERPASWASAVKQSEKLVRDSLDLLQREPGRPRKPEPPEAEDFYRTALDETMNAGEAVRRTARRYEVSEPTVRRWRRRWLERQANGKRDQG